MSFPIFDPSQPRPRSAPTLTADWNDGGRGVSLKEMQNADPQQQLQQQLQQQKAQKGWIQRQIQQDQIAD